MICPYRARPKQYRAQMDGGDGFQLAYEVDRSSKSKTHSRNGTSMIQAAASEDDDSYSHGPVHDTFEYLFDDGDGGTVKTADILVQCAPIFHRQELDHFWGVFWGRSGTTPSKRAWSGTKAAA